MSWLELFPAAAGWLAATSLLALRIGALLLLAAPLSVVSVPPTVRMLFGLALAVALGSALPPSPAWRDLPAHALIPAALSEACLGAIMALGINLAFSAYSLGGRLLDVQMGFGMGQVLDPVTKQQVPVISSAFGQLAIVLFWVTDAHHNMLRGLALSAERIPVGTPWLLAPVAAPLVQQVASVFALGFAMVAPVVFCLLLVEVGLGVLARNLPQMNTFMLAIPLKVIVGVMALAAAFVATSNVVTRINASIFTTWGALFP